MKRLSVLLGLAAWAVGPMAGPSRGEPIPIAPGVTYELVTRPGPVVLHVLRAALGEATLTPTVVSGGRKVLEIATLPEIVARDASAHTAGPLVAGALNGGFGLLQPDQGGPIGLLIADGELLCDPWPVKRTALIFPATGGPRLELLGLRGTISGIDGRQLTLNGLNRPRMPGELVLYSSRFNPATRNRDAGRQVVLTKVFTEGTKLAPGGDYTGEVSAVVDGQVNLEIPPDGVVLAGSGRADQWLSERRAGERVTFRFEMVPNVGAVRAAVGAGPRIVRDGRVSVEAEQEGLGVRLNMGRQPRSAVGISADSLVLVAADGRQPDYSIGIDLNELAQVLVDLGCTQGMELDGGGATTMFVRDRLINRPSDGQPRALASALLLLTSGKLSEAVLPNPTIAASGTAPVTPPTVTPPGGPTTVDPGGNPPPQTGDVARLSVEPAEITAVVGEVVPLKVVGLGAAGQAVVLDLTKLSYEVGPAGAEPLGEVDAQGRFVAKREGNGRLTVRYGDKFLPVTIRVTPASPPVAPPVAPPVTPPTTPPTAPPVSPGPLRPGRGEPREKVTLPTGTWKPIDGFEEKDRWHVSVLPPATPASCTLVGEPIKQGSRSLKLSYDFTQSEVTRAAYLRYSKGGNPVKIGSPKAVSVWVFGDGNGHWLRGICTDKNGTKYTLDFAEYVNWDHYWARCSALIPKEAVGPLTWDCIYLVEHRAEAKTAGYIFLDDFQGIY